MLILDDANVWFGMWNQNAIRIWMMSTAEPPQGQQPMSNSMCVLFECGRFKEFECEQQIVGGARAQSGRTVGGGLLDEVGIVDGDG